MSIECPKDTDDDDTTGGDDGSGSDPLFLSLLAVPGGFGTSISYFSTRLTKGVPREGDDTECPVPEGRPQRSRQLGGGGLVKLTTVETQRDPTSRVSVRCPGDGNSGDTIGGNEWGPIRPLFL